MEERANRYTTMLVLVAADLLPHRREQLQPALAICSI